ncbi:MAG: hypothetical protein JO212_10550 [Acetobacteraceae bacterium]|nr:hypothetical protein [Acetobacteraceae bacterium]
MIMRSSLALLLPALALAGCTSGLTEGTRAVAGIAGSAVGRAITSDPAVTTGIGLGFLSGADAGVKYAERRVHGYEQERIAEAAGPLQPGAVGVWSVRHSIPMEANEHGLVVVSREFGAERFRCKEIVFSVEWAEYEQQRWVPRRTFYTTNICLDGATWRWAAAEPATERWGALQ